MRVHIINKVSLVDRCYCCPDHDYHGGGLAGECRWCNAENRGIFNEDYHAEFPSFCQLKEPEKHITIVEGVDISEELMRKLHEKDIPKGMTVAHWMMFLKTCIDDELMRDAIKLRIENKERELQNESDVKP